MTFARAVDHLLEEEGGYIDNPADPGGETAYGISKRAYPDVDIKSLTPQSASAIYARDYWAPIKGDSLPDSISFALLDFAANSGVETAVRALQKVLGVWVDGHLGPATLTACSRANARTVVVKLSSERLRLLRQLVSWNVFGEGWQERVIQTAIEAFQ